MKLIFKKQAFQTGSVEALEAAGFKNADLTLTLGQILELVA